MRFKNAVAKLLILLDILKFIADFFCFTAIFSVFLHRKSKRRGRKHDFRALIDTEF